jgi:tRNA pseudouridine38-40 synthase
MARYKITLAYDGSLFQGFQRQRRKAQDVRTVQGVFEGALRSLGWDDRVILAAGRTDTGVHASGQVVAFDLEWNHPPGTLQAALNAALPQDIAVQEVTAVAAGFHPRYDARARCYCYRLVLCPERDPLRYRYTWRVWPAPNLHVLQMSSSQLLGKHDFAAFGAPPRGVGSTVRTVFQADWLEHEDELVFNVSADAFLYHMVRRLVYAQVAIAQGRLPVDTIKNCLADPGRLQMQGLAPAQGLVLAEVIYE